jgi:hypothetical protein
MVTTLADAMFQTEQDLRDVQRLPGWICKIRDLFWSNGRPFVILRLYQRTGIRSGCRIASSFNAVRLSCTVHMRLVSRLQDCTLLRPPCRCTGVDWYVLELTDLGGFLYAKFGQMIDMFIIFEPFWIRFVDF